MIRHTLTTLTGLAILAGAYWALAFLPFSVPALAFLLFVIAGALNFVWMALVIGMMIFGAVRNRPGLIAAPPLFFAIWLGASVANRYQVAAETDPTLANRTVPAELKDFRTVTLVSPSDGSCCGQIALLADGLIDRYVHARDDGQEPIGPINLTRLAAATDCTIDELRRSDLLQRTGRTGECLKTTAIDLIPDGLVIRLRARPYYPMVGCCTVGTINVRQNGEERPVATWHSGRRTVFSFFPLFGIPDAPDPTLSLWDPFPGGPTQMIWIGGRAFTGEDLVAAAYGIDWAAAPKAADVSIAELIRRAVEMARGPSRAAALDIALIVQGKGVVDDDILGVVSSFIETARISSPTYRKIEKFWFELDPDQQRKFIELVLTRMQDPNVGFDYNDAQFPMSWMPERFPGVADRALRIFEDRHDLRTWQYEQALRLARNGRFLSTSSEYVTEQRQRFSSVRDDTSAAFVSRAVALKRVYLLSDDEQREFFARQLDRVPDARLDEYLSAAGWHRNSQKEPTLTAATRLLRERAAVRIAAVQDEKLRRELQGHRFRDYGK
ncbi:MAG: hypothetical protein ABW175_03905 [Bradyrhizobium sp.]